MFKTAQNLHRIHLALQIFLFGILQVLPLSARLNFNAAELAYPLLALAWLFWKPIRQAWRTHLRSFLLLQVAAVILYYNLHGQSLSLVSFFSALLPAMLWGMFELVVWSKSHLKQAGSRQALFLCTLAWGIFALAYPPLPLGPAGIALLAPWFLVLWTQPLGRVLFATFWSGILFNSISYFWIFNVAKVGPPPAVIGGLFLLVSFLSSFHVLAAWIFVRLRDLHWKRFALVWLFPIAWVGIEVLRSYGQISFPWGHLGYVFGNHIELIQGLSWMGIYGYSALILYSNMILAYALPRKAWKLVAFPIFVVMALSVWGAFHIRQADQQIAQHPDQNSQMRIALVQPSILQTKKWSRGYYDSVLAKTWSMLDTVHTENVDIVVLPETAVPDFLALRPRDEAHFRAYVQSHNVDLLVGALNFDRKGPPPRRYNYYNSAFLFEPNGAKSEFRKTRLVPFSEYLPFNGLLPLINYVDLGEGDFSPGTTLPLFGKQQWTPNICYESIYPDLMRAMVRNGSRFVINITNDGWFGKTTAPGQHANLVRYRAIESGLPIARCANSGVSIFYDAQGRSFERTQLFDATVVYHTLTARNQTTFYSQQGDFIEGLLASLFGIILLLALVPRKFLGKVGKSL